MAEAQGRFGITCFERPHPGVRTAAQATAESVTAQGVEEGGGCAAEAGADAAEVAAAAATEASDGSSVLGLRLEEGGVLAVLRVNSLQLFKRGEGGASGRSTASERNAAAAPPEAVARSAALQKVLAQLEADDDW